LHRIYLGCKKEGTCHIRALQGKTHNKKLLADRVTVFVPPPDPLVDKPGTDPGIRADDIPAIHDDRMLFAREFLYLSGIEGAVLAVAGKDNHGIRPADRILKRRGQGNTRGMRHKRIVQGNRGPGSLMVIFLKHFTFF
jgi:hypothetical protein